MYVSLWVLFSQCISKFNVHVNHLEIPLTGSDSVGLGRLPGFCLGGSFPGSSDGEASAYNAGDPGSIPGSGRSPGEGNGNPLQYSCLENPMDRGAWWATVHGVAKSWTWLSHFTSLHFMVTQHWKNLASFKQINSIYLVTCGGSMLYKLHGYS